MAISDSRLQHLRAMIEAGTSDDFYGWTEWTHLRREVLEADRWECQICKQCGRYRKAIIVHHVKHLRDRPDLALSMFDPDTGERQLVSVCRACHEDQHPERGLKRPRKKQSQITPERWD